MAIFAHPDDESLAAGGLIASCAAAGSTVTLVVATRGEGGPGGQRGGRLAETRTREMEAAARVLGVAELMWLDYPDGMLPSVDAMQCETEIAEAVAARRPDRVVTFDSDGLYWHPDHVALHERVTAAVARMGRDAPGLWYVTMPTGAMRAVAEHAAATGMFPTSILGIDDADAFGAEAPAPTLSLDISRYATRKLAALACHATQFRRSALAAIAPSEAATLLGLEQYRRAQPVPSPPCT